MNALPGHVFPCHEERKRGQTWSKVVWLQERVKYKYKELVSFQSSKVEVVQLSLPHGDCSATQQEHNIETIRSLHSNTLTNIKETCVHCCAPLALIAAAAQRDSDSAADSAGVLTFTSSQRCWHDGPASKRVTWCTCLSSHWSCSCVVKMPSTH